MIGEFRTPKKTNMSTVWSLCSLLDELKASPNLSESDVDKALQLTDELHALLTARKAASSTEADIAVPPMPLEQTTPNPAAAEDVYLLRGGQGPDSLVAGRFVLRGGPDSGERAVYAAMGDEEVFMYHIAESPVGSWWVGPAVGKRAGQAMVVSDAHAPEGIREGWSQAGPAGAFVPDPTLRCVSSAAYSALAAAALAAAAPARVVHVSGKLPPAAESSACLLGAYERRELRGGRHVYRRVDGDEWLYYMEPGTHSSGEGEWWIGDALGERGGFLYASSAAWAPEAIEASWHVFAEEAFVHAPGVGCSASVVAPPTPMLDGGFVDASFPPEAMTQDLSGAARAEIDCFREGRAARTTSHAF